MGVPSRFRRSALRLTALLFGFVAIGLAAYFVWQPGLEVQDGRHDRQRNGIWLAHGWLGGDEWFLRYHKTNEFVRYRHPDSLRALASRLRQHHITDVFPHLCPADPYGALPPVDAAQVERVLDELNGIRVIPWVGGPNGANVRLADAKWRSRFVASIAALLAAHPRLAGAQLNVEPLPTGDTNFLSL